MSAHAPLPGRRELLDERLLVADVQPQQPLQRLCAEPPQRLLAVHLRHEQVTSQDPVAQIDPQVGLVQVGRLAGQDLVDGCQKRVSLLLQRCGPLQLRLLQGLSSIGFGRMGSRCPARKECREQDQ